MGNSAVKRAFKFRFYPDDAQTAELSRTFGCVRKVYSLALSARAEAWTRRERVNHAPTSAQLALAISDAARRELRNMLEYEAAWYGRFGEGGIPSP